MAKSLAPSLALLVLTIAPAAGGTSERTETVPYENPAVLIGDAFTVQVNSAPEAVPARGEKTVSIVLEDESGRPVAGLLHQGDSELANFCGATEQPVRLVSRKPVHVHVYSGPGCSDMSIATRGTVAFTFAK
ncbi:MAG TPA: hypothetical protein VG318_06595 [Actinomycetota bacterium]|nr:hypothetical protein [Actinomycetota bacterium]